MSSKKTQPLVTRRKPKVRPSGDRTEGAGTSVLLPRRTPQGSPLRLGTLSWGVVDSWRQSAEEFRPPSAGPDGFSSLAISTWRLGCP